MDYQVPYHLLFYITDKCQAACPDGWDENNGKCYYAGGYTLAWNQAEDFCVSNGGHLASFADITERVKAC